MRDKSQTSILRGALSPLSATVLLCGIPPALANEPDVGAWLSRSDSLKRDFVRYEGPCKGMFQLPDGYVLVPESDLKTLDLRPFEARKMDLDNVIKHLEERQRAIAEESKRNLEALGRQEDDAVARWVMDRVAAGVRDLPITVQVGTRAVVVTPTLFGTFSANFPTELPAGGAEDLTVRFTPRFFFPGHSTEIGSVVVGPRYASPSAGLSIDRTEVAVSGSERRPFRSDQREQIIPEKEILWTWHLKAQDSFKSDSLGIEMLASDDRHAAAPVADFTAKLTKKEWRFPWFESIGGLVTTIVGVVLGSYLTFRLERSKRGAAGAP